LAWRQCDFSGREIPDWKPVLALADAAREEGDPYYAKSLYLQGGKFAVWRDDWAGLLTAACGIKKLERERGPYSSTNALLLRAMVAAEKRQSRLGLVAVAKAFAALGEDKVASMALSRIGKNWVEETNDSAISFHLAVGTSKRETVVENNVQGQDARTGDQWTVSEMWLPAGVGVGSRKNVNATKPTMFQSSLARPVVN
jgi:hypothetical protein